MMLKSFFISLVLAFGVGMSAYAQSDTRSLERQKSADQAAGVCFVVLNYQICIP